MKTADFDYDLPPERIAQSALPRGRSRLLHLEADGSRRHRTVGDLPGLLDPGDLLVVNDTRVIPARIVGRRAGTGGRVELLLVERVGPTTWRALAKPGRKATPGTTIELGSEVESSVESSAVPEVAASAESTRASEHEVGATAGLTATVTDTLESGQRLLKLSEPIEPHLAAIGHTPLPPYIRRPDTAADSERYQTVYAEHPGAVAAPTAGLHFSAELLDEIRRRGVEVARVTLHVGIGTFRPVQADSADDHPMESERCEVPAETAEAIRRTRAGGGRILAVGTTVVRTLEATAERFGGDVEPWSGRTDLFIRPGFPFRVVDRLLTNFHLPRSTLLMLVAAFAGRERILAAYREAIEEGYRFYSYGDAMLIEKPRIERSSVSDSSKR